MRWSGLEARIGDRRSACRVLMGDPRKGAHLKDLGVDGRIVFLILLFCMLHYYGVILRAVMVSYAISKQFHIINKVYLF
jgi:hypothetical protein